MLPDLGDLLDGGGGPRVRPERKDIWKIVLAMILIFGVITLYVLEFTHFGRTFHAGTLIKWCLLLGILLGIGLGHYFAKPVKDQLERIKIYALMIFLSAATMPLLGSLSNRLLTFNQPAPEQVEFVEIKAYTESRFGLTEEDIKNGIAPSGYYLFFVRDNKIERIPLEKPLFESTKRGAMIDLPILKGLWGYEVVSI